MSLPEIDWDNWEYGIHATLMFIVQGDEILHIEKKRGLGAGKVNGPGGKIDPGETALEAVIRETEEELCITPTNITKVGELQFEMSHVPNIRCHVYRAEGFEGTPPKPMRLCLCGPNSMPSPTTACGRTTATGCPISSPTPPSTVASSSKRSPCSGWTCRPAWIGWNEIQKAVPDFGTAF